VDQDQDLKPKQKGAPDAAPGDLAHNPDVEEFFKRLSSDLHRPKPSQDAIAAALQAVQSLAMESMERQSKLPASAGDIKECPVCGAQNRVQHSFCSACGAPFAKAVAVETSQAQDELEVDASPSLDLEDASRRSALPEGQHFYHHHYHHYVAAAPETGAEVPVPARPPLAADASKPRPATPGAPLNKSESAVRKMTQDWALACNTKQLDDLLDFYAADAIVLRSNTPPVRGTAGIREFFFAALDAGLGEVEMDPIRTEIFGDLAYEAGRCKMLVPSNVGKRREERGKYLVVFIRQYGGEWKAVADCWSSDLSLGVNADSDPRSSAFPGINPLGRPPRRSA